MSRNDDRFAEGNVEAQIDHAESMAFARQDLQRAGLEPSRAKELLDEKIDEGLYPHEAKEEILDELGLDEG
jgi:SOS response regulatory protein OraA/RecX